MGACFPLPTIHSTDDTIQFFARKTMSTQSSLKTNLIMLIIFRAKWLILTQTFYFFNNNSIMSQYYNYEYFDDVAISSPINPKLDEPITPDCSKECEKCKQGTITVTSSVNNTQGATSSSLAQVTSTATPPVQQPIITVNDNTVTATPAQSIATPAQPIATPAPPIIVPSPPVPQPQPPPVPTPIPDKIILPDPTLIYYDIDCVQKSIGSFGLAKSTNKMSSKEMEAELKQCPFDETQPDKKPTETAPTESESKPKGLCKYAPAVQKMFKQINSALSAINFNYVLLAIAVIFLIIYSGWFNNQTEPKNEPQQSSSVEI